MTISGVSNSSGVTQIATDSMGGVSLNMRFAQLQLQASENAKEKAEGLMQQVEKQNKEQADLSEVLRALQHSDPGADKKEELVDMNHVNVTINGQEQSLVKYLDENPSLKDAFYDKTGGDDLHLHSEINKMITTLQTHMESKGTDTQTLMIQLQDLMGQYNNFLQGAKSAVDSNKQTLNALVR